MLVLSLNQQVDKKGEKSVIDGGKSILMERWVTAGVGTDAVSK